MVADSLLFTQLAETDMYNPSRTANVPYYLLRMRSGKNLLHNPV